MSSEAGARRRWTGRGDLPRPSSRSIQKLPLHPDRDARQQTDRSPSLSLSVRSSKMQNFSFFFLPVFAVTASALPRPAAKWLLKLS